MSIEIGGSSIGEVYAGSDAISEIYKGNDLLYSSVGEISYIFRDLDSNGNLTRATGSLENAEEIKKISNRGLKHAFYESPNITGNVSFPALKIIGEQGLHRAFYHCTGIGENVSFSELTTVQDYGLLGAFTGCTGIKFISFPKLEHIQYYGMQGTFENCSNLTGNIIFPKLNNIYAYYGMASCFRGCTAMTSIFFPSLTSNSFGTYRNQFDNMLSGVSGCIVHFPSNLQSVIGSWSSVTAGFSGTNTSVLFDLASTE